MSGINFDFTELDQLSADLGKVPDTAGPFLRKAIEVTARKIKDAAQAKVTGSWSGAARGIDYEVKGSGSGLEAEVGYNKSRGGGAHLGNLREYGAPNAKAYMFGKSAAGTIQGFVVPGAPSAPLAPHNDLQKSLQENQADFIDGISIALRDAEKAAGL